MSDAEVRAWALATGKHVSDRGKVSQALRDAYSAAHGQGNGAAPGPDYPDGMSDDDFDLAQATEPDDMPDETPPRPISKAGGSRLTGARLTDRLRSGGSSAKRKGSRAKPKQPRVSTANLIGSAWRIGAKIAQPIPPMYRVLRLESVIAGPLLDDAVKGTFVDPWLQPLARAAAMGDTIGAMMLPPAGIGAAAAHLAQCAKNGTEPNPVILQMCTEVTRHGLIAMMRVGGDAFAQQLAREKEEEEKFGASADAILEWIFSAPSDPGQEEANIAAMAARFAGEDVPAPEPETMPA